MGRCVWACRYLRYVSPEVGGLILVELAKCTCEPQVQKSWWLASARCKLLGFCCMRAGVGVFLLERMPIAGAVFVARAPCVKRDLLFPCLRGQVQSTCAVTGCRGASPSLRKRLAGVYLLHSTVDVTYDERHCAFFTLH